MGRALVGRALMGRALMGRARMGWAIVGQALTGRGLVGRALLGRALGTGPYGPALVFSLVPMFVFVSRAPLVRSNYVSRSHMRIYV